VTGKNFEFTPRSRRELSKLQYSWLPAPRPSSHVPCSTNLDPFLCRLPRRPGPLPGVACVRGYPEPRRELPRIPTAMPSYPGYSIDPAERAKLAIRVQYDLVRSPAHRALPGVRARGGLRKTRAPACTVGAAAGPPSMVVAKFPVPRRPPLAWFRALCASVAATDLASRTTHPCSRRRPNTFSPLLALPFRS